MSSAIIPIQLSLSLKMGTVNCYLIDTGDGFFLIDTGTSNQRIVLESFLEKSGCHQGDIKLIILTHGDFDHTGNAAYLRDRYHAKLAMHSADAGMLRRGNMFWNRNTGNPILNWVAARFSGFGRAERCEPDYLLEDGSSLLEYGLEASIVHLPGHSQGSIGVLTKSGELFCGDLFEMGEQPQLNSIMDDLPAAQTSVAKLKALQIDTVYPGHGKPFPITQISHLFD